jgi:hypothetical protein
VCRFHIAASKKLHADKLSGAIVRSVAKLLGINLQKCGSFSYWFDNLGFTTEGKLAVVLIIPFPWGFQLGAYYAPSPDGSGKAPEGRRAFFGPVEGGLERGSLLPAAAAPKGGRRGDWRFFGGQFCLACGPRAVFSPCRTVPMLPIGSCRVGADAGALAVYLGSNGRRHVFGLACGTPIWAPSSKSAPTAF